MSKGSEKRKLIFTKYVSQLTKLKEHKLIVNPGKYIDGNYVCPICLQSFSESDLLESSPNMLTLEDAPPKSLGGKANTLTCKTCNNRSGHMIDFHLTERLIELDIRAFKPNVNAPAKFIKNGIKIGGELNIDPSGTMTIKHDIRYNNPGKLDEYIQSTEKNDIVEIEFKQSRVDKLRLEVALLKSAYLIAFEHFGYSLILSPAYDIVRKQLLNPEKEIYPEGFWTKQSSFRKENEGVYVVTETGYEGFYSIFCLKTQSSEYTFGVYLPISDNKTTDVVNKLKQLEAGSSMRMVSYMNNDYFEDVQNMKMMSIFLEENIAP